MSSGGRGLVLRAALPHHVPAHRAVRHLRADVEQLRRAVDRVEVLGEGLPTPTRCPRDSAAPGMSSTPSIRPMSHSCGRACTGANPTPQLPITIVVTPCQHVGVSSGSQVTWPSKCVCTSTKPGVTSAPSASTVSRALPVDRADLGDDAVGDRDVGGAAGRAGPVDDRAALDHEIVHVSAAPRRRLVRHRTKRSGSSSAAKWPPRSKRV